MEERTKEAMQVAEARIAELEEHNDSDDEEAAERVRGSRVPLVGYVRTRRRWTVALRQAERGRRQAEKQVREDWLETQRAQRQAEERVSAAAAEAAAEAEEVTQQAIERAENRRLAFQQSEAEAKQRLAEAVERTAAEAELRIKAEHAEQLEAEREHWREQLAEAVETRSKAPRSG